MIFYQIDASYAKLSCLGFSLFNPLFTDKRNKCQYRRKIFLTLGHTKRGGVKEGMTNQTGNDKMKDQDQNKQEKPLSQVLNVALIGFVGGVLWSILGEGAYYFSFTEIWPRILISGWASDRWKDGFLGFFVTILLYGVLSILVAYLYYALLRKVNKLFICILFGVIIWAIVHVGFVPFFADMVTIKEMNMDTLVTTICLYILYGVFIGVSISFDESERTRLKELEQSSQA